MACLLDTSLKDKQQTPPNTLQEFLPPKHLTCGQTQLPTKILVFQHMFSTQLLLEF